MCDINICELFIIFLIIKYNMYTIDIISSTRCQQCATRAALAAMQEDVNIETISARHFDQASNWCSQNHR